jgi:hypothetical protein
MPPKMKAGGARLAAIEPYLGDWIVSICEPGPG